MATLTIELPMVQQSYKYYDQGSITSRKASYTKLVSLYGNYVQQAVTLNNLPAHLLEAVVLVENDRIDVDSVSAAGAVGIAMIKPLSATDILVTARKKRLLSAEKQAVLKKRLGSRMSQVLAADLGKTIITAADLKDPEFSLMLAGIYLSLLIAEHQSESSSWLQYVVARYNQGYYLLTARKIPRGLSVPELIKQVPGECKNYLVKMLGVRGWLDILTETI
jgi:hypothetical protein